MAQNLAAQPDFTAAAQSMRDAADEIEKCSNLPAINEGAVITNAIQALETRLSTSISDQILASEARLSAQIQTLSARVLATYVIYLLHIFNTKMSTYNIYSEHNNKARLQNGLLRLSSAPLTVLHDIENNPIEPFPRTPAAMQRLRG
jgi:hypothetical protein